MINKVNLNLRSSVFNSELHLNFTNSKLDSLETGGADLLAGFSRVSGVSRVSVTVTVRFQG